MDLKEIRIWNIKYNLLTISEIVDIVSNWLGEGRRGIHLTGANPETVAIAQDDKLLHQAIMESDIVNVDSFLPTFFLKKNGFDFNHRVPTPEVFEELMRTANEKKQKVFFLGAKQNTLDLMRTVLEKQYPNMNIVGMRNGYYTDEEEPQIAEEISQLAPDYLFVGMSSPKKERFILKYKHQINVGVLYGVGGAFDAKAGVLSRPPKWLQGGGMEYWLRVIRNPRYYGKRMPLYFKFIKLAMHNKVSSYES